MGRKPKLTPELTERICESIRQGVTFNSAAIIAGISKDTFYDWLRQGQEGRKPHSDFSDQVSRARAESEQALLQSLQSIGKHDWRSRAWVLERRFPDDYGNKVEHRGKVALIPDEKLDQTIDELLLELKSLREIGVDCPAATPDSAREVPE